MKDTTRAEVVKMVKELQLLQVRMTMLLEDDPALASPSCLASGRLFRTARNTAWDAIDELTIALRLSSDGR